MLFFLLRYFFLPAFIYNGSYISRQTLLIKISSDIISYMNKQRVTVIVMIDLSSAFDTDYLEIFKNIYRQKFNIQGGVYLILKIEVS